MKVTIHGPNLADQSQGTFRVHAAECGHNDQEVRLNGSLHPDTQDVDDRRAVVDLVYPDDQFDREPDDYPMYRADFYFCGCCASLPERSETINEGGDDMAERTPEELANALAVYDRTNSYRATGRELGMSADKAKSLVEAAKAQIAAAEAAARSKTARRASGERVPVKEDASAMVPCRFCKDKKGHAVEHPATTEFWYANKSTGDLHTMARCKTAERIYREAAKKAKTEKSSPASDKPVKAGKSGDRHLTAVA